MHEFALADAVISAALETADKQNLSHITAIAVRIGELQQIDRETFEFALKEVIPNSEPRLAGTSITLEVQHASFRCRACEAEFTLDQTRGPLVEDQLEAIHFIPELARAFIRCPDCRSLDFELLTGRGVSIDYIEGE
ncbi:MAG: hydrogenase nickel incorporation protein HypA [Acidobacteriota bacterium]|nr:MAG: hydrogenase nickel incorporation protein HypA [Acidobacteriota bacterium]